MRRVFPLLLAAALAGCAALRPPETPDTMRLAPPPPAATAPPRPGLLVVAPVQASGMTAGRRYVYVTTAAPLLLHRAATLFWEVPPAETIDRALVVALRSRIVAVPGAPNLGRLSARLARFEEVDDDGRAEAVVALDAELTGAAAPASTAHYCRASPIGDSSSGTRAAAFQASVAAIVLAVADGARAGVLASDC